MKNEFQMTNICDLFLLLFILKILKNFNKNNENEVNVNLEMMFKLYLMYMNRESSNLALNTVKLG